MHVRYQHYFTPGVLALIETIRKYHDLSSSDEWNHVPIDAKIELELTSQDDGEFWMCFRDFCREYCNMIICNLSPDFDHDGVSDKAGKSAEPQHKQVSHVTRKSVFGGFRPGKTQTSLDTLAFQRQAFTKSFTI